MFTTEKNVTFGKVILEARKRKGLKLKDCASLIFKEDNTPISFQYLSDLELDQRRPPSEHIVDQLATILNIPVEVLYFYAGIFPKNLNPNISQERIITAYKDFVKSLS